jgi:NitT/TauT family transport system permease protein
MDNKIQLNWVVKLLPLLFFLVFWEFMANYIERGTFYYGSPTTVAKALYAHLADGRLFVDTFTTLYEVIAGFVIGNIAGTILGLAFWYNPYISALFRPYILVAGAVPAVAFAPLIILFFGIGLLSKIMLVVFATVVVATVQAFEGASQANPNYIRLLQSFGASRWLIFKKVIVPSSLVWLFTGFKLNIGFAILGAFVGEFISSDAGLGHMIEIAKGLFNMPVVLAGIVMIALVSILLNSLIARLQRKFLPWEYATDNLD